MVAAGGLLGPSAEYCFSAAMRLLRSLMVTGSLTSRRTRAVPWYPTGPWSRMPDTNTARSRGAWDPFQIVLGVERLRSRKREQRHVEVVAR